MTAAINGPTCQVMMMKMMDTIRKIQQVERPTQLRLQAVTLVQLDSWMLEMTLHVDSGCTGIMLIKEHVPVFWSSLVHRCH